MKNKIVIGFIFLISLSSFAQNDPGKVISLDNGVVALETISSQKTPIRKQDLNRLKEYSKSAGRAPYVVRMKWADPSSSVDRLSVKALKTSFQIPSKTSQYINLETSKVGGKAVVLPGESVVFHNLMEHQTTLVGKYNPGLINSMIAMVMGHKYVEALFWQKFYPESIPDFLLLSEHTEKKASMSEVRAKLNKSFPNGWVMKGVYDQATSADSIITDKTNLEEEFIKYKESDFEKHRADSAHLKLKDRDAYFRTLRKHSGFTGWRIKRMLRDPHLTMVQSKVAIKEEYRVEVVLGRVLGKGSTVPRHSAFQQFVHNYSKKEALRAEAWAQEAVDRLPVELRHMPMALDVAALADGTFKIIESNPQGNSGFLTILRRSSRALDKLLQRVPEMHSRGQINWGMSAWEQVKFIEMLLAQNNLDKEVHFPDLKFRRKQIIPDTSPLFKLSCKSMLK